METKIFESLQTQIKSLISSSHEIIEINREDYDSDQDSIGSISSADFKEVDYMLNSDHQHRFQAKYLIRKFL